MIKEKDNSSNTKNNDNGINNANNNSVTRDDNKFTVYHLCNSELAMEKVLAKLLEKIIANDSRVHLKLSNTDEVEYYDKALWLYEQLSFLPHGCTSFPRDVANDLPIYLSDSLDQNINNADTLIFVNDISFEEGEGVNIYNSYNKVIAILCDDSESLFLDRIKPLLALSSSKNSGNSNLVVGWRKVGNTPWQKIQEF